MSHRLALLATLAAMIALASDPIPVRFTSSPGLAGYTGKQPFTFGVPFPPGTLRADAPVCLLAADGTPVATQVAVTATWSADGQDVRWLLVDGLADVTAGQAAPLFLAYGPGTPAPPAATPLTVSQTGDGVTLRTGARDFTLTRAGGNVGSFVLQDGQGGLATVAAGPWTATVELAGPVRAVVRVEHDFITADGRRLAQSSTRYRAYAGQPFVRVYHTMTWLTDHQTTIGKLAFRPVLPAGATLTAGLDGRTVIANAGGNLELRQEDWQRVDGTAQGRHLDGWLAATAAEQTLVMALRWPWQQHPTALAATARGEAELRLIGPPQPMSLAPLDVAVPAVKENIPSWNLRIFRDGEPGNDVVWNGPEALAHVSPRGVARTWELLLWYGQPELAPELKNAALQQPLLAYAAPAFAVRAGLPSPSSPYDPQRFPELESGLQRAFDWYTRAQAEYGDYGTWNWGDLQWQWAHAGAPIYRYWMNNGKGWSVVPWALYLRSGDRRYFDHGEANSRHAMDVDLCHVPEWERSPTDYKLRGGQYHYSAIHWGYGPQVFSFFIDSEYLPYYYYLTGYERAWDVTREHAEAIARWHEREAWMTHFRGDVQGRIGRHLYVMIKNLAVLYQATWDPRLKALLDECLELTLAGQYADGNFPHVKTNHYLDEPLNLAANLYGWDKVGPALTRWLAVQGDPLRPGPTGNVSGPMSPWTSIAVYRHTGDAHWLDIAARLVRTQAACLATGDPAWDGLSAIPAHEAGPLLRDWPIVMGALAELPPQQQPSGYLPAAGVNARLPVPAPALRDGWSTVQHLALTHEPVDGELTLILSFVDGVSEWSLQVLRPDGGVALERQEQRPPRTLSVAGQTTTYTVPADGLTGVYAIVVRAAGKGEFSPGIYLASSTGKLLHATSPRHTTVMAGVHAAQVWLQPLPGATVRIGYPLDMYVPGRYVLLDEQLREVAASTVTQTMGARPDSSPALFAAGLPWGPPLTYQPPAAQPGLHALLFPCSGDWHRPFRLAGIRPWVALTREQWFDPATTPAPDLTSYLGRP
jgi:hypothetical protein